MQSQKEYRKSCLRVCEYRARSVVRVASVLVSSKSENVDVSWERCFTANTVRIHNRSIRAVDSQPNDIASTVYVSITEVWEALAYSTALIIRPLMSQGVMLA